MKNPLTKPPLDRVSFAITICPKQQKARLRGLYARWASLVKQRNFIDAQIASAWKNLLRP